MARLRDVPHVLRSVGPFAFAKRILKQGSSDQVMTLASALAYSWLFAVFPFFVFLLTFVPKFSLETKDLIRAQLGNVVKFFPKAGADTFLQSLDLVLVDRAGTTIWLRVIGLVLALWGASGGMSATMAALDRCYEIRKGRPFFRQRLLAISMTFIIATLIVLVMLLLPVGGLVKAFVIRQNWPGFEEGSALLITFDIARWALAIPFMLTALTIMYHWGPAVRHRFHWITPGSVFCLLSWIVLGLGFKIYFERFASIDRAYGTIGGVAVMLLVFYMDAAMLLWGAEINSEIDFEVLKVERGTRDFISTEKIVEAEGPLEAPPAPVEPPPT